MSTQHPHTSFYAPDDTPQSYPKPHPLYAPTPVLPNPGAGELISPGGLSEADSSSPVTPYSASYASRVGAVNPYVVRKFEDDVAQHLHQQQQNVYHHHPQHPHYNYTNQQVPDYGVQSGSKVEETAYVPLQHPGQHQHYNTFGLSYQAPPEPPVLTESPRPIEEPEEADLSEYFSYGRAVDPSIGRASNAYLPPQIPHTGVPADVDMSLFDAWSSRPTSLDFGAPASIPHVPILLAPAFDPTPYATQLPPQHSGPPPSIAIPQLPLSDRVLYRFDEALAGVPPGTYQREEALRREREEALNQQQAMYPPPEPVPSPTGSGSTGSASPNSVARKWRGKMPPGSPDSRSPKNNRKTASRGYGVVPAYQQKKRGSLGETMFARALKGKRSQTELRRSAPQQVQSRLYSDEFPEDHYLVPEFLACYHLQAQIGSGGFGFVMTAKRLFNGDEVAVKFISKAKIPLEHLVEDPLLGTEIPMEAFILRRVNFPGIVKFIDFFQDTTFFYLVSPCAMRSSGHSAYSRMCQVQELHGSPWYKPGERVKAPSPPPPPTVIEEPSSYDVMTEGYQFGGSGSPVMPSQNIPSLNIDTSYFMFPPPSPFNSSQNQPRTTASSLAPPSAHGAIPASQTFVSHSIDFSSPRFKMEPSKSLPTLPVPLPAGQGRPNMSRRPSHDLFECIEQHKRIDERMARKIFMQVVETVEYLDTLGICHRDIKDENLVVDSQFNVSACLCSEPLFMLTNLPYRYDQVKLIDFGSAVIRDTTHSEPYYDKFFGTITFASSGTWCQVARGIVVSLAFPEILRNQPYRARPAEVWTLGVLLCFLVTGESPFPDNMSAIAGKPVLATVEKNGRQFWLSYQVTDLIKGCLRANPNKRFKIQDIKNHIVSCFRPYYGTSCN